MRIRTNWGNEQSVFSVLNATELLTLPELNVTELVTLPELVWYRSYISDRLQK